MQQRFDTWQRGLRRAGCRIFAVFGSVVAVLELRSLAIAHERSEEISLPAVAAVLLLVVAAARGFLGRTGTVDALAFTCLVTAAALDPPVLGGGGSTGGDANPAFLILAATLLAYIVAWTGPMVPAALVGAAALYGVCSVVAGGRHLDPVLDETILLVTSDLAIWILFRELHRESRRADEAHHRAITERAAAARVTAAQRAIIAAQRTLHDRVLAALLQFISVAPQPQGSGGDAGSYLRARQLAGRRAALREVCRQAADAVRSLGTDLTAVASTTDVLLQRRIQRDADAASTVTGVTAVVRRVPADQDVSVPGNVDEAVGAAVAEALRNVGRHSGVKRADVLLTATHGGGLRVEVVDRGHGLPRGTMPGFGLRQSVVSRLREVGGTASIEGLREGGTRVTIRWLPADHSIGRIPQGSDVGAELAKLSTHPRVVATEFSGPLFLGALYLAFRYPYESSPMWTNAAVFGCVLVFTGCCIAAIPTPKALWYAHASGFVLLPAVLGLGLYLSGSGSLLGFECWVVGLAGFPLLVLAMVRPLLPVLALAFLESGVVAASAVADPGISPIEVLAPITQTPMFVGLLAYGVAAVRRVRVTAEEDERARAVAAAESQAAEVRQRVIEKHYDWLLGDVGPYLDDVAAGRLDPTDPAVQNRASVLALAIRDELALPGQISDDVRDLIALARSRGIRVRARAIDEWSAVPEELARVLTLLAAGDGLTDITLSLPHGAEPRLRVVVRPRLSSSQKAKLVALLSSGRVDVDEDDFVSIVTFTPGARSEHGPG